MNYIYKRDGKKEKFNEQKIIKAIEAAYDDTYIITDAGLAPLSKFTKSRLSVDVTKNIVNHLNSVFGDDIIPTVENIQDVVIEQLKVYGATDVAKNYIEYRDKQTKKRTLNSKFINEIKEITHADSKTSNRKRENGNIDGNTAMGTMLQYGQAVSKEYCKMEILSEEFSTMHDDGDIHIHDLDFYNMGTVTCNQIDLEYLFKNGFSTGHGFLRTPNSIASYAALCAIAIQSDQNDQHGGQSIPMFDYYMAPGVAKTFVKEFLKGISKHLRFIIGKSYNEIYNILKDQKMITHIKDWVNIRKLIEDKFDKVVSESLDDNIINILYQDALDETDKQTYQAMEGLVHNLNTMHSRAGAQVPFSSINFGTDTSDEGRMVIKNILLAQEAGLGNGETPIFPILIFKMKSGVSYNPDDPNYDLFKLACRVSAKRLFPTFSNLDAPFNAKYLKDGKPETEACYMGCRTRVIGNVAGPEVVTKRGNLSFTTLNLPRLGIEYGILGPCKKTRLDLFYKDLEQKIDACCRQLLERYEYQKSKHVRNFPFLMGQGLWRGSENLKPDDQIGDVLKHGTLSVGFIGLAECLKALIGKHHAEDEEAQKLGLYIIKFMKDKLDEYSKKYTLNFTLLATPAEGIAGRFTKIDKEKYGIIDGVTDRLYYTNSNHVPVYYKTDAFNKIKIEAPYHEYTLAGHIMYIEMDGDPTKNLEAFESVVRAMHDNNVGYGAINHPVDRCCTCGYTGVIEDKCPKCDSDYIDRIRRVTGYLVGTLDKFNDYKKAEEKDRVKHI